MPPAELTFAIDLEQRLVRVTGTGDAQSPDWIALFDRVIAAPGFEPGMNFLVDRRGITSVPTRETVTEIVHYYATHKAQLGHCRVASVTTNDAAYGMNRMAGVFAEETTVRVQVFRHMDQAYRWARWGDETLQD